MTMTTQSRQINGVTILDLNGRIILGAGSDTLVNAVNQLLNNGQNKILLNMANVTYVDSSGVGALVRAFTTVRKQNGQLKLLNLTRKVQDLLHFTHLSEVFEIKDEEEAEAVHSFAA